MRSADSNDAVCCGANVADWHESALGGGAAAMVIFGLIVSASAVEKLGIVMLDQLGAMSHTGQTAIWPNENNSPMERCHG